MAKEALAGEVVKIRCERRNDDGSKWVVGELQAVSGERVSFTGSGTFDCGDEVTLYGSWDEHPKYGRQFKARTITAALPVNAQGLLRWLERNVHRVGPVAARRLVDTFGTRLPELCQTTPDTVAADGEVPLESVQAIASAWKANGGRLAAMTWLLGPGGLNERQARAALAFRDTDVVKLIQDDPFQLIGRAEGFGWKTTDELAERIGVTGTDRRRLRGALAAAVREAKDDDGWTCVPLRTAAQFAADKIKGTTSEMVTRAVEDAVAQGDVELIDGDTLAPPECLRYESLVWSRLALSRCPNPCGVPDEAEAVAFAEQFREFENGRRFTDEQMAALVNALRYRITVITGGAGCLHANTPILDPMDGTVQTAKERWELGEPFHVWSMNADGQAVIAFANAPVKSAPEEMVELTFASGRTVTVTLGHRIWDGRNYICASEICARLLESGPVPLPSISAHDLSTRARGASRSTRITADYLVDYFPDSHQYGEQPPASSGGGQLTSPLQGGARRRNRSWSRWDGQGDTDTSIVPPSPFRLAMPDCIDQIAPRPATESELLLPLRLREAVANSCASLLRPSPEEVLSCTVSLLLQPGLVSTALEASQSTCNRDIVSRSRSLGNGLNDTCEQSGHSSCRPDSRQTCDHSSPFLVPAHLSPCINGASSYYADWDQVIKAESAGRHEYYDFHVPGYENYWCEGVYHHNSGKTLLTKAVLDAFRKLNVAVSLCAPTGKAAKRITELVGHPASTIHRLLQFNGHTRQFMVNAKDPLPRSVVVIDEASMCDSELTYRLLSALSTQTAVVFVGDPNQLPPVGSGAVLRDILDHDLAPTTRLSIVHRQAGALKFNSVSILSGKVPPNVSFPPGEAPPWLVEAGADTAAKLYQFVRDLYSTHLRKWGLDPVTDTQFLTAQKKGAYGIKQINLILQHLHQAARGNAIDAPADSSHATDVPIPIYTGDKVIQTKNNYELDVFNGETGVVIGRDMSLSEYNALILGEPTDDAAYSPETHLVTPVVRGAEGRRLAMCPVCLAATAVGPGGWHNIDCRSCGVQYVATDGTGTGAPPLRPRRSPEPVFGYVVNFGDRVVAFPAGPHNLELAYCISVHKSQGSQYPCAVVIVPKAHAYMHHRNWFYTGVTRAAQTAVILGDAPAIVRAAEKMTRDDRDTLLRLFANREHLRPGHVAENAPPPPAGTFEDFEMAESVGRY